MKKDTKAYTATNFNKTGRLNYQYGPDWCMTAPTPVDSTKVASCNADKHYRCPLCNKRVRMAFYNRAPHASPDDPKWCWPAHKIRKTKR